MSHNLPIDAVQDLATSGLTVEDVSARPITIAESAACHLGAEQAMPIGYVIPYFDIQGKPIPYYRVKLCNAGPKQPKYKGPSEEGNYVYFPRQLADLLRGVKQGGYIIVTEGEKKAAACVKQGFPCVALSGVYSWKSRQLTLPAETQLQKHKRTGDIVAKIPKGDSNSSVVEGSGVLANGFNELVDLIVARQLTVIIIFDSDKGGLSTEVQRAAAQLGYEFRYRGVPIPRIRLAVLPGAKSGEKVGLDDYLVNRQGGVDGLRRILGVCLQKRIAFPRHPNAKTFIASRMQNARMTRKECQDVSLAILMELEARGKRMRNKDTQEMFYFDEQEHLLMPVVLANPRVMLHDTNFGAYLYTEFNMGAADQKVVQWLAAQYNGEPGIEDAEMHRVLTRPSDMPNNIAYQISDTHYVIVTSNPEQPFIFCSNGSHGVMFQQGCVAPLDGAQLQTALDVEESRDPKESLWYNVLKDYNFDVDDEGDDKKHTAWFASLLYYLSPWFHRWKGMQLPIELIIGEPGSGKTSLFELRQLILNGQPRMSNMTNDVKDWYAGITSANGLHVIDNVHFTGSAKDYRQRLSDEYCRLTTESKPHIEMRKLYTTNDIISFPVNATFGITAIEQPFFNTDFLQRSAIFEVRSVAKDHDAKWVQRQLESGGGRYGWVAHHLWVIHRFLRLALHDEAWNSDYRAGHRLAHYEQGLVLMAKVFGMQDTKWIPELLSSKEAHNISEADWVMQGLTDFAAHVREKSGDKWHQAAFTAQEIATWAEGNDNYYKNTVLTNSRKLGKYLKTHASQIRKSTGIIPHGTINNRARYKLDSEE